MIATAATVAAVTAQAMSAGLAFARRASAKRLGRTFQPRAYPAAIERVRVRNVGPNRADRRADAAKARAERPAPVFGAVSEVLYGPAPLTARQRIAARRAVTA